MEERIMKRISILLLIVVLSLMAAGCGAITPDTAVVDDIQYLPTEVSIPEEASEENSEEPADESTEPGQRTINIGVSIYKFDDCYMTLVRNDMSDYIESLGRKHAANYSITILDGRGDHLEQYKHVDDFIARGVDVMIINLVQTSLANVVTEKAKAAGIPVVYLNREPGEEDLNAWDKICYVGTNPRQSGTFQGEIVRDLPDNGDADGDGVVRYVMIMGDPENADAQYRTELPIKALTDAGIQVECLFQQRGDWEQSKGQEIASSALAQFGSKVDVIFCNNDGMAMGAILAIQAAGRVVGDDIYLVGIDAIPEAIDAIYACNMTGTVLSDNIGQAHTAIDAALRYAYGEKNDTYIWVDYVKVG